MKYSTNDFFAGVTYKIDLTKPKGERITDLKFADGSAVTDKSDVRIGMNSYRMGHLTKKGGVLEGRSFPVLFDTEAEYGEEQGTIRNLTIRYLTEVKDGVYIGKPMQRWQLKGLKDSYAKQRDVVKQLINDGKLDVPSSADGRYSNIESINVKPLLFGSDKDKQQAIAVRKDKLKNASDAEKVTLERELILIDALNWFFCLFSIKRKRLGSFQAFSVSADITMTANLPVLYQRREHLLGFDQ